jgi:hypothetical protein
MEQRRGDELYHGRRRHFFGDSYELKRLQQYMQRNGGIESNFQLFDHWQSAIMRIRSNDPTLRTRWRDILFVEQRRGDELYHRWRRHFFGDSHQF